MEKEEIEQTFGFFCTFIQCVVKPLALALNLTHK